MKHLNSPKQETLQTPALWNELRDAHRRTLGKRKIGFRGVENMVRGVIETAKLEINFLYKYRELMVRYKYEIRE